MIRSKLPSLVVLSTLLLTLIIVFLYTGTMVYKFSRPSSATSTISKQVEATPSSTAGTVQQLSPGKKYSNPSYRFSFIFPEELEMEETSGTNGLEIGLYTKVDRNWIGTVHIFPSNKNPYDGFLPRSFIEYLNSSEVIKSYSSFQTQYVSGYKTEEISQYDGSKSTAYYFENNSNVVRVYINPGNGTDEQLHLILNSLQFVP